MDAGSRKAELRLVEASFARPAKRVRVDEEEEEYEEGEEEEYEEDDGSSMAGGVSVASGSAPSVNGLLSAMEL